MRANEFIVKEGPGDWMQGQVIKRKQINQAKILKKNAPKIANLLSQNIIAVVNQIPNPKQKREKAITMLSKALKVDVTRNREVFGNSVDDLLSLISDSSNQLKPADITDLVQEVVTKSMTKEQEYSSVNLKLVSRLKAYIKEKDLRPAEAREYILELLVSKGHSPQTADRVADEVLGTSINNAPKPDNDELIDTLKDQLKDALLVDPASIMKMDPDKITEYIRRQLIRNNVIDDAVIDLVIDELMNDPDMPFNYEPTGNFRGLVYSPDGTRYIKNEAEKNIAFVKNKNRWSQWIIGPSSTWKYSSPVTDKVQVDQLDVLANQATADIVPMNFRIDNTEGTSGMFRVSAR